MFMRRVSRSSRSLFAAATLALALLAAAPAPALAHCDTMDGPVVSAARAAIERGAVTGVLIWVQPEHEAEVTRAFRLTRAVRVLGEEARQLADRSFFETVVRLHRQGEGEPYTGLKPAGTNQGPVIPAADRAVESGSSAALEALLVDAVRHGLHERFDRARAARRFAGDDIAAGRAYVAAYVELLHWVEAMHATASVHAGTGHHDSAPPEP